MPETTQRLATEKEARDVAERARQSEWTQPSFLQELFLGRFRLDLVQPYPDDDLEELARAKPFLDGLRALLDEVDSDEIDRTGQIPDWVMQRLRELGAFGIKIPTEYGGLGLGQVSYIRALELVSSKDASINTWLSAHQSIGVPQPLKVLGTPEQKERYLPRLAKGAVSAFALTEVDAGSDPANMHTTATPTEDGSAFVLNGEKLWCTNGPDAELMVVMALTPGKSRDGKPGRKQITAFVVEANSPGVEVVNRCEFMGLKAISNGVIRFTNVRVPRENILSTEGAGLKLALTTLNTGRLTLAATAVGVSKAMLRMSREWANERVQWGQPIGRHEAIAHKVGRMAAQTFAMEAMVELVSAWVDKGGYDIRLEAAMTKTYCTEAGWQIVDDALQIRGGAGYETAASLAARGQKPMPIERAMRDFRIFRIFEGSSEITHLAAAREAVDYHMKTAFDVINPKATREQRKAAFLRSARFYPKWYATRLLSTANRRGYAEFGPLAGQLRYIEHTSARLGREIFHAMVRLGAKLERRQLVLFRAVDVGAELFAMTAACMRAQRLAQLGQPNALELADTFCREAQVRIEGYFRQMFSSNDAALSKTAERVLGSEFAWLEQGIVDRLYSTPAPVSTSPTPPSAPPAATQERQPVVAGASD
jgi:alkylation response protein AidB-like acyl-CoA dehydrogenase